MCHGSNKNHRVSLVALMTSCVTRADERLRVFSHSLPYRGERYCLPACTRLGQDPTDTKFRSSCRSPPRGYPRSIHPHYLSVYASTSHFEDVASITASRRLIDSLQHSIRSLWLRATPTGVTPACHQTISSPHVHCIVSICVLLRFCHAQFEAPLSDTCITRNFMRVQRSCGCQVTTQLSPWQGH